MGLKPSKSLVMFLLAFFLATTFDVRGNQKTADLFEKIPDNANFIYFPVYRGWGREPKAGIALLDKPFIHVFYWYNVGMGGSRASVKAYLPDEIRFPVRARGFEVKRRGSQRKYPASAFEFSIEKLSLAEIDLMFSYRNRSGHGTESAKAIVTSNEPVYMAICSRDYSENFQVILSTNLEKPCNGLKFLVSARYFDAFDQAEEWCEAQDGRIPTKKDLEGIVGLEGRWGVAGFWLGPKLVLKQGIDGDIVRPISSRHYAVCVATTN